MPSLTGDCEADVKHWALIPATFEAAWGLKRLSLLPIRHVKVKVCCETRCLRSLLHVCFTRASMWQRRTIQFPAVPLISIDHSWSIFCLVFMWHFVPEKRFPCINYSFVLSQGLKKVCFLAYICVFSHRYVDFTIFSPPCFFSFWSLSHSPRFPLLNTWTNFICCASGGLISPPHNDCGPRGTSSIGISHS